MLITKLKSKIHRVTVTDSNLSYEGSCGISIDLLQLANIQSYEQIHLYNVNNGERFTTYAIEGEPNIISVRGAAARKAVVGDILIICTYCQISEDNDYQPINVYVDSQNNPMSNI
jgi:aspartate 1-decarboxylase